MIRIILFCGGLGNGGVRFDLSNPLPVIDFFLFFSPSLCVDWRFCDGTWLGEKWLWLWFFLSWYRGFSPLSPPFFVRLRGVVWYGMVWYGMGMDCYYRQYLVVKTFFLSWIFGGSIG